MNRFIHPTQAYRPSAYGALIEWEELPSLSERLVNVDAVRGAGTFQNPAAIRHSWDVTLPAALDPLQESGPFQETLSGLATRELREPDVFRHFFK